MWDVITDEYIKTVLRDRQGLLTAIHDRLLELYHEMDNSDEAIKSVPMKISVEAEAPIRKI